MPVAEARAASTALRTAAAACTIAGGLTSTAPLGWVPGAVRPLLEGAASLVDAGPGWDRQHRNAVRVALTGALAVAPGVTEHDARDIADGVAALVTVVRRWVA